MPKLSFNVSYYYTLLLIINFYEQFLKLNFKISNLSLKITYKDKVVRIFQQGWYFYDQKRPNFQKMQKTRYRNFHFIYTLTSAYSTEAFIYH